MTAGAHAGAVRRRRGRPSHSSSMVAAIVTHARRGRAGAPRVRRAGARPAQQRRRPNASAPAAGAPSGPTAHAAAERVNETSAPNVPPLETDAMRQRSLLALVLASVAVLALGRAARRRRSPRVRAPRPVAAPAGAARRHRLPAGAPARPAQRRRRRAPADRRRHGSTPATGPNGKNVGDTTGLTQFESGVEYEPRSRQRGSAFSLEDADLPSSCASSAQLTGKRFIFGGKVRNIKATVYSPQKVTVAEAYQAFLSILETQRADRRAARRFLKIIDTAGRRSTDTPVYSAGQAAPPRTATSRASTACRTSARRRWPACSGTSRRRTATSPSTARQPAHHHRHRHEHPADDAASSRTSTSAASAIRSGSSRSTTERVGHRGAPRRHVRHQGGAPAAAPSRREARRRRCRGEQRHAHHEDRRGRPEQLSRHRRDRARVPAHPRAHQAPRRPANGRGRDPRRCRSSTPTPIELAKTLNEIITGAAAAGGGRPRGAGKPRARPRRASSSRAIKVSADKATNSIVVTSSLRDFAEAAHRHRSSSTCRAARCSSRRSSWT